MMLFTLSDIDECTSVDHPHNCDSNANCTDTEGDFECACNGGWTGNGTHCEGRSQSILTFLFSRRASRGREDTYPALCLGTCNFTLKKSHKGLK